MKAFRIGYLFAGLTLACMSCIYMALYLSKNFMVPAATIHYLFAGSAVLMLVLALVASNKAYPLFAERLLFWAGMFIRACLVCLMLFYSLGKIANLQFAIDPATLNKPATQLSDFESAWLFFSRSYKYGMMIALLQIAAAVLLCFRRTVISGALALTAIMANIIMIDFEYGVVSMQETAVVLFIMGVWLLVPAWRRILDFIFSNPPANEYPDLKHTPVNSQWIKYLLPLFFIFCAILFALFYRSLLSGQL
jgi:hypothetical protein